MRPLNKFRWGKNKLQLLQDWWPALNSREFAEILGTYKQKVRDKCYSMGMYRMRLEYWTPKMVDVLKANYKYMGDTELAEIMEKKFPKSKRWTIKHIEKKRKYLKLHRSEAQLFKIKIRNLDQGRMTGLNWTATHMRRRIRVGTYITRTINGYKVRLIRIKGGFRKLAHVNYEKHIGPIPAGTMITLRDRNPLNCEPENLEAVTRQVFAERMRWTDNSIAWKLSIKGKKGKRGNYKDEKIFQEVLKHPELIALKRNQLKLQQTIKQNENH